MIEQDVEFIRRFKPMSSRSGEWDFLMVGPGKPQRWCEIEDVHRVLIIAALASTPSDDATLMSL